MNILFLVQNEADATLRFILEQSKKTATVTVIDLRTDHEYDAIIEQIESCDKVISW